MELIEDRKLYFRRPKWQHHLCISWDDFSEEWMYYERGKIMGSKASQEVIERRDFIVCNKGGEPVKTKGTKMERDVNYIGGDYRVVEVSYEIDSTIELETFYFKCDVDVRVENGTIVVVESKRGLGIAKVIGSFDNCLENADIVKQAMAWVVDTVDYSTQEQRKKATERRGYIIGQLEEKKEQLEAINMYKMLADLDPSAAKLLEELKTIGQ